VPFALFSHHRNFSLLFFFLPFFLTFLCVGSSVLHPLLRQHFSPFAFSLKNCSAWFPTPRLAIGRPRQPPFTLFSRSPTPPPHPPLPDLKEIKCEFVGFFSSFSKNAESFLFLKVPEPFPCSLVSSAAVLQELLLFGFLLFSYPSPCLLPLRFSCFKWIGLSPVLPHGTVPNLKWATLRPSGVTSSVSLFLACAYSFFPRSQSLFSFPLPGGGWPLASPFFSVALFSFFFSSDLSPIHMFNDELFPFLVPLALPSPST